MMDEASDTKAVLICGPTASGKSALALELAREFGGVVINADSMQVYAELRIITNRPTPADEAGAPHRLYGVRPAREPYSAALWLADVKAALDEAKGRGRPPIIVGGTGLYFKALTEGLSGIPDIPEEIRARYRIAAQKSRRRRCTPNSRAAIRSPPRAFAPAIRSASSARSKCSKPRAVRSPNGRPRGSRRSCRSPKPSRS